MPSSSTMKDQNSTMDASSIRSTSTMSSLRALLPSSKGSKRSSADKKGKPETVEQQITRREATVHYLSIR
jgi:hypothetical protein